LFGGVEGSEVEGEFEFSSWLSLGVSIEFQEVKLALMFF
jgi:hypothetical protein